MKESKNCGAGGLSQPRRPRFGLFGVFGALAALGGLGGCRSGHDEPAPATGSVTLALTGTAEGVSYRLSHARFTIAQILPGGTGSVLDSDTDPNATFLTTTLSAGDYSINLETGWALERSDTSQVVEATLTSPNPTSLQILAAATTNVTYRFATSSGIVTVGSGTLVVGISVSVNDGGVRTDAGSPDTGAPNPALPGGAGIGGGGTGGGTGSGAGTGGMLADKSVFVIVMADHSWSDIKGSASAPYLNQLLAGAAHAEAYFTPPGVHPAEPNYIWMEAGSGLGIANDNDPSSNHQSTTDHLVSQLTAAGISWRAYAEEIDGQSCPLVSSGLYMANHVPFLFFDDITDRNSATSATCIQHVRPHSELAGDLLQDRAARYSLIVPNRCHDMRGETSGFTCQSSFSDLVKMGDDWLAANVPAILASAAYQRGGVLFIVWDQGSSVVGGSNSDGPIGMIALSPTAKPGYASSVHFDHGSLLRTLETIYGVPLLREAQSASDLGDLFSSFP